MNKVEDIQLRVDGENVCCRFHLPDRGSDQPVGSAAGVLVIPGFADTAVGPHNLHVESAKSLVSAGFAVLRFDYRGQGESEGQFEHFTLTSGLADAQAALACLQAHPAVNAERLGIVGYSLGGAYAVELAAAVKAVRALVLLAPVAEPQRVFRSFFAVEQLAEAAREGWVDWLGWQVGRGFLQSLDTLDPLRACERMQAKGVVLHGTEDREVPAAQAKAFASKGCSVEWLEGMDHTFGSVAMKKKLQANMQRWFAQHLNY